ncbi:conserved protein of unknown function [Streptococcus thermophilus]|uniref:Uncharacterized protein n=2 Tax=Streptococcus thermophilus TaxID=1308 RepID=A0A7U7C773_STRTR|nr:conserved protein of unknown function [Streptococcus thermophilus]CAD0146369.1 conserved protein of unknown function [Streptococcus thermophilus]CAD0148782.1 conserved protein of unknown function [Streptococcus thermophilus]CAD0151829.1 conserved protein of unknown function [Streptococcus thermophilus]CAD0153381.1 conserved protein of unknown function [Streptococcus thermophilus]
MEVGNKMKYYTIKRGERSSRSTIYIVCSNFEKDRFHIMEYMIMSFLFKKDIQGVDAVTTEDFIKFKIFNPLINIQELMKIIDSDLWFSEESYYFALSEIKQENALISSNISNLLNKIICTNYKLGENVPFKSYKEWFYKVLSSMNCMTISNQIEKSADFSRKSADFSELTSSSNRGVLSYNDVDFFYSYIKLAFSDIPNFSSFYFLQNFSNHINKRLKKLRNSGIYYAFCFCKYHREYVEFFIVISINKTVPDCYDYIIDELTAIYRAYDYCENHDTGMQEFKEDLCAIYLTDSFIESNIPEFTSVQNYFVNKIILMLGGD